MRPLPRLLSGLLLGSLLFVSACSKDDMVNETMDEVTKLTDEIVTKINEAEDKKAAIAEAKQMIAEREDELGPKMEKISGLRGYQVSDETVGNFTESLFDNGMKMASLEIDLMIETAQDPELAAELDELVDAHSALLELE